MNIKDVSTKGVSEINAVWLSLCIGNKNLLILLDGNIGDVSLA